MISVILPTYNPDVEQLRKTLSGLNHQTLDHNLWEIIIIDNNSTSGFQHQINIGWHKNASIISELTQGLTHARLKGIAAARFEIIVMVDDDNILAEDYLHQVAEIFSAHAAVGAIGGKVSPLFQSPNNQLALTFRSLLAIRDLGEETKVESFNGLYPAFAPIGAGMAFRKCSITQYVNQISSGKNLISDRKGNSLSSSGDNEMVWEIFKSGWDIGYFPQLHLLHIIPAGRTTKQYLARLNFQIQESWALFLLKHGLCPWKNIPPFTLPFRKFKAWLSFKAWRNDVDYIKWRGSCGTFSALASFKKIEKA